MERSHQPANTTSTATNTTISGVQPSAFSWTTPMFPMPRPRVQSAGSDRVPGAVRSHRPRWTKEKHARILADIKATRTDLDPSFPRPVPLAATPPKSSASYQLTDVIGNLAQRTKSCFDSLTGHALELYYGGEPPDEKRTKFVAYLHRNGLTKDEATDLVLAWTSLGIPLNAYTAPRYLKEKVSFSPGDLHRSFASEAAIVVATWEGKQFILKCYGALSIAEPSELLDLMAFRGLPVNNPRREVRCLLASHIARELFGWDITPEASLAFVGGRVCVVTPRVEGVVLGEFFKNNLRLFLNYLSSVSDKSLHLDTWGDRFAPEFKKDYIRLALLAKVVGDVDRHLGQFLVSTENRQLLSITGIDWDMAFSSTVNADRCTLPGGVLAWWPDPIAQDIVDEFNKVADNDLKAMATAFEMSPDEVDAILSRFHDVQARLATIRKT